VYINQPLIFHHPSPPLSPSSSSFIFLLTPLFHPYILPPQAGASETSDPSLIAYTLQMPDESTLAQDMSVIDPVRLRAARGHVKKSLSQALREQFLVAYEITSQAAKQDYEFTPEVTNLPSSFSFTLQVNILPLFKNNEGYLCAQFIDDYRRHAHVHLLTPLVTS
jgi:hypothetical protein